MKFYQNVLDHKVFAVNDDVNLPSCEHLKQITPNTTEAATEKHLPVLNVHGREVEVSVGSVLHPMLEAHYIEWILLETNKGFYQCNLKAGDTPHAHFFLDEGEVVLSSYAYCNLHSLWKA